MNPQRPFARYPYQVPRYPPPPGYVGPAWAAPGPRRPLPRKSGDGWLVAVIVGLAAIVGAFMIFVGVIVLFISARSHTSDTTAEEDAGTVDDEVDAGPANIGRIPARTPVDPSAVDPSAERAWRVSRCSDEPLARTSPELRSAYQTDYVNRGTAKRMRGRVAVIHLMLTSPSMPWSSRQERDVDRMALLDARYFRTEANRHSVNDLVYVPIAWMLSTTLEKPQIAIDDEHRVTTASSRELVRRSLVASEGSLGSTMAVVAQTLKSEGYAEVAFLVHLPITTKAREFAYPAPLLSNVDVAVIFDRPLDQGGSTSAHEIGHLFGADDLYPLTRYDPGDALDLMRAACYGYSGSRIGDMTAWSIGWRSAPPARVYPIGR